MSETREAWLERAIELICVSVFQAKDYDLRPETMRVSCSWPAGREPDKVIGQCWPRKNSPNGVNEMFINPTQADPVKVLGILTHEMVHAYDDCESKHGGVFKKIATKIGLEGKMKSAFPGPVLLVEMTRIAAALGPYPHRAMSLELKEKKQKTYMLKCTCAACDFLFRTTQAQIDLGPEEGLFCPGCGEQGTVAIE